MSILLDDKKIRDVLTYDCTMESYLALDYIKAGTKAQAKKFAEFLLASNNLLTKEGRAVILEIIQQLGGTCL